MKTKNIITSDSLNKIIARRTTDEGKLRLTTCAYVGEHLDHFTACGTAIACSTRVVIPRGTDVADIHAVIAAAIESEQETTTTEEQEYIMETTTKTTTTTNEEQEYIMSNTPITATKPITTTADGKEVYLDDYADCVIAGNSRNHKAVVDLCLTVKYQPAFDITFDGVVYIVAGGEYIVGYTDADAQEDCDFQITVPAGHNIATTIRKSIERLYTDDVERDICERFERMCNR